MGAPARTPEAGAAPLFLERWSPRALSPEPLSEAEVAALFEAARWSPSCFNEQPWHFVYGTSEAERSKILETLVAFNRAWAAPAPLLIAVFARRHFAKDGSANRWAAFDAGAAWMALALQAQLSGLRAHAMGGFDAAKAHALLGVPEGEFEACCVVAVGRPGDPASLPEELRGREHPTPRRPLAEVAVRVAPAP